MKQISFLVLAAVLSGCCAYCNLDTNPPKSVSVGEGEKAIATFYVQNVSYLLFGVIPICSGETWKEGGVEHADDFDLDCFDDRATLDENMKCLDHACDIVGSHRIANISHNINEDPFWSLFICNRRTIKTQCLILEPKKPPRPSAQKSATR